MLLIKEGKNYGVVSECNEPRIPKGFEILPFTKIIESILGKKYFVSIAFVRQKKMRSINLSHRKKDSSTDVLSFPLTDTEGEVLLCLPDLRKKAREFGLDAPDYTSYLLIHALLHLKGLAHGSKMEEQEKKFCNTFKIKNPFYKNQNEPQNNSRNRHRNLSSARSGSEPRRSKRTA